MNAVWLSARHNIVFPAQGPFRVELRSVNTCPASDKCFHPEKVNVENMKITKDPNNPYRYTYSADVNVTVPVEDTYKVIIRAKAT